MIIDGKSTKPCDEMTLDELREAVRKDALSFITNEERRKNIDEATKEFEDEIVAQYNSETGSVSACGWNVGMWM